MFLCSQIVCLLHKTWAIIFPTHFSLYWGQANMEVIRASYRFETLSTLNSVKNNCTVRKRLFFLSFKFEIIWRQYHSWQTCLNTTSSINFGCWEINRTQIEQCASCPTRWSHVWYRLSYFCRILFYFLKSANSILASFIVLSGFVMT